MLWKRDCSVFNKEKGLYISYPQSCPINFTAKMVCNILSKYSLRHEKIHSLLPLDNFCHFIVEPMTSKQ